MKRKAQNIPEVLKSLADSSALVVRAFLAAEGLDEEALEQALASPLLFPETKALGLPQAPFIIADISKKGILGALKEWSEKRGWDSFTKLRVLLFLISIALGAVNLCLEPVFVQISISLMKAGERFNLSPFQRAQLEGLPGGLSMAESLRRIWEEADLPTGLSLQFYFTESSDVGELLERILKTYAPEKLKDKQFIARALIFLVHELYHWHQLERR